MTLPRRRFLHVAAGVVALPELIRSAGAQTYPSRQITLVVPFPPGGSTDVAARIIAEKMKPLLGQPSSRMSAAPVAASPSAASRARHPMATPSTSASGTRMSAASSLI